MRSGSYPANGSERPRLVLKLEVPATSFRANPFELNRSGCRTCLGGSHFEFSAEGNASLNSGVVRWKGVVVRWVLLEEKFEMQIDRGSELSGSTLSGRCPAGRRLVT